MKSSTVYFANGARQGVVAPPLWQWDYGQKISVFGLTLPEEYVAHICCVGDVSSAKYTGDSTGIEIPDALLEDGRDILVFIYLQQENGAYTSYSIRVPVKKRPKPTST